MVDREKLDNMELNELYEWVQKKYEQYTEGEIEQEEYLEIYNYYKDRYNNEDEQQTEETVDKEKVEQNKAEKEKINPDKVRSTSIAGLRKKLLEEMRK